MVENRGKTHMGVEYFFVWGLNIFSYGQVAVVAFLFSDAGRDMELQVPHCNLQLGLSSCTSAPTLLLANLCPYIASIL